MSPVLRLINLERLRVPRLASKLACREAMLGILFIFLLTSRLAAQPCARCNDHQACFRQGIVELDGKQWSRAAECLQAAIRFQSHETEERIRIGEGPFGDGGLAPESYHPHFFLGLAYLGLGSWENGLLELVESERQGTLQRVPRSWRSRLRRERLTLVEQTLERLSQAQRWSGGKLPGTSEASPCLADWRNRLVTALQVEHAALSRTGDAITSAALLEKMRAASKVLEEIEDLQQYETRLGNTIAGVSRNRAQMAEWNAALEAPEIGLVPDRCRENTRAAGRRLETQIREAEQAIQTAALRCDLSGLPFANDSIVPLSLDDDLDAQIHSVMDLGQGLSSCRAHLSASRSEHQAMLDLLGSVGDPGKTPSETVLSLDRQLQAAARELNSLEEDLLRAADSCDPEKVGPFLTRAAEVRRNAEVLRTFMQLALGSQAQIDGAQAKERELTELGTGKNQVAQRYRQAKASLDRAVTEQRDALRTLDGAKVLSAGEMAERARLEFEELSRRVAPATSPVFPTPTLASPREAEQLLAQAGQAFLIPDPRKVLEILSDKALEGERAPQGKDLAFAWLLRAAAHHRLLQESGATERRQCEAMVNALKVYGKNRSGLEPSPKFFSPAFRKTIDTVLAGDQRVCS